MKIKVRHIVLVFLVCLVPIFILYKYYEWSLLQKVSDSYNNNLVKELRLDEQAENFGHDIVKQYTGMFPDLENESENTEEKEEEETLNREYEKLLGKGRLLLNAQEDYIKLITKNKDSYAQLSKQSKYILGARGKFIREFINKQTTYYNKQLDLSNRYLIKFYVLHNLFNTWKEEAILTSYREKTNENFETEVPLYFSEISVLEKYTDDNFKFEKEDKIKETFPYAYEVLKRKQDYFASFYNVDKEIAGQDYESALYKVSRLNKSRLDLNIDIDRLFSEGEKTNDKLAKNILEANFIKIKLIKDFKQQSLWKYPLLKDVSLWKEDLELCQLYSSKFEFVKSISEEYPKGQNFDNLIQELSTVTPKSDEIDKQFNKDVVNFSRNDEKISFECRDVENDEVFKFNFYIDK